jgi:hypothetical protein
MGQPLAECVAVKLAVNPPVLPMLSKRIERLPPSKDFIFEPKWDGFRSLIFRDGDEVMIQSREAKPLNRYFPELIEPLQAQLPKKCALDGEIVIATSHGLDFEALQMRIHPAESRVKMLARESPASIVFFDLLCEGEASTICAAIRSSVGVKCWNLSLARQSRRSISLRLRVIQKSRRIGSAVSKARASTASWRSRFPEPTSPTSA